jgi:hypothetical protein
MSDEKQGQFVVKGDAFCVTHGVSPQGFAGAEITRRDSSRRLRITLHDSLLPGLTERGVRIYDSSADECLWVSHAEVGYLAKVLSEARAALDYRHPEDAYTLLSELPLDSDVAL